MTHRIPLRLPTFERNQATPDTIALAVARAAQTHPQYRPDIDGLRALAVLLVVFFHAFPAWLPGGFIGVDIFFVISGFLISTIIFENLEANRFRFTDFYSRRIKRIFPALLTVLTATYAGGWLMLPALEYQPLGKHIAGGAGFMANFVLWLESGYFDTAAETKPLLHLWSLGIEEQFYIVWPVLLWFAWKRKMRLPLLIMLAAAISFSCNIAEIYTDKNGASLYYSPLTRFWELLVGSALAYLHFHLGKQPGVDHTNSLGDTRGRGVGLMFMMTSGHRANPRSWLGLLLIIVGVVSISKDNAFPGWWALLPVMGATLLIAAGPKAWFNHTILSNRVAVWFGLISFPLYLWHWPLLSFARIIEAETPSPAIRAGAVALAIILAWLTKQTIEAPIRQGPFGSRMVWALAALMTAAGFVGYVTFVKEGLPGRYGKTELLRESGNYECADEKKNRGCVFGNTASGKLVVITGDSHAEHFAKAMQEALGERYQFQTVINGSCFMGDKLVFPHIGNLRHCTAAREKLRSLQSEKIHALIRVQRWHAYLQSEQEIQDAVNDTITGFGLKPERVILVGSTADVPIDCEVANYYARSPESRMACGIQVDYKLQNKAFISATQSMRVPPNVSFIYPYATICPDDICRVVEGNISLYKDSHHLSRHGALELMPEFAAALER